MYILSGICCLLLQRVFSFIINASWTRTCTLTRSPLGPTGPCGPSAPLRPFSPGGPSCPLGPIVPRGPCWPCFPGGPYMSFIESFLSLWIKHFYSHLLLNDHMTLVNIRVTTTTQHVLCNISLNYFHGLLSNTVRVFRAKVELLWQWNRLLSELQTAAAWRMSQLMMSSSHQCLYNYSDFSHKFCTFGLWNNRSNQQQTMHDMRSYLYQLQAQKYDELLHNRICVMFIKFVFVRIHLVYQSQCHDKSRSI